MSKLYDAKQNSTTINITDKDNNVFSTTLQLNDISIIGQGKAPTSVGIVLADGTNFTYIPNIQPNIIELLEALSTLAQNLNTIASSASGITSQPGPTATKFPQDIATTATQLTTAINKLKETLI